MPPLSRGIFVYEQIEAGLLKYEVAPFPIKKCIRLFSGHFYNHNIVVSS